MKTSRPHLTARLDDAAVTIAGLSKRYGRRTAVDHVSFELPRGVVAGYIGPNGAGKTTTMAMLLGLVRPTGGTATVLGEPIENPAAYLNRVGALIETPAFYKNLSGRRNLQVLAAVANKDGDDIPRLLGAVGLGDRGEDAFRSYSHGMKQRLGIAGALLGDPELLLLDEPINGLDPGGIREIRELIGGLADGGRTVLVSSHVLAELEQVANWLIVIDHGQVRFQGTPSALSGNGNRFAISTESPDDMERMGALLAESAGSVQTDAGELLVTLPEGDPKRQAADLNRLAAAHEITLAELRAVRTTLEESYFNLLNGDAA